MFVFQSGRSAAWLARLVRDQEVGGSNPLAPTIPFNEISEPSGFSSTLLWAILSWSNPEDYTANAALAVAQNTCAVRIFSRVVVKTKGTLGV
jgi:hypothetical protein